MSILVIFLGLAAAVAIMVLRSVIIDEVRGRIARRITASVEATIASLPAELQEEWAEEWRGELAATISMPIAAALFARGLRRSAREFTYAPASRVGPSRALLGRGLHVVRRAWEAWRRANDMSRDVLAVIVIGCLVAAAAAAVLGGGAAVTAVAGVIVVASVVGRLRVIALVITAIGIAVVAHGGYRAMDVGVVLASAVAVALLSTFIVACSLLGVDLYRRRRSRRE